MRKLYKKFKQMTGKRGADLAEANGYTRQYISLLANNPNWRNNKRLGEMMEKAIRTEIAKREYDISALKDLQYEISIEISVKKSESA
jgi:hypothetical protein